MKITPTVIFKNQPKLSGHAADVKRDVKRTVLLPLIENLVRTEKLFAGSEAHIEFAHTGVSSLVCFITANKVKYVLKIPLSTSIVEGEARFLKEWEAAGVSVPHIHKEGNLDGHPYIIMSFVDAPILREAMKDGRSKKKIYAEMGKTLRKMHEPKISGYGNLVDNIPQYKTFHEWVNGEHMQQKMINVVKELNLLDDTHGPFSTVIDILSTYCKQRPSSFCHLDFGTGNILATNPLTVIDPQMLVNNRIIDLGRTMQLMISGKGDPELIQELRDAYFSGDAFDEQALHAAIVLSAYMKFPYWNRKGYVEQIENTKRYLIDNRHLLTR